MLNESVRVLLEVLMDRLAIKFHETKDLKISDEIYRLAGELGKLDGPWVFRSFALTRPIYSTDFVNYSFDDPRKNYTHNRNHDHENPRKH